MSSAQGDVSDAGAGAFDPGVRAKSETRTTMVRARLSQEIVEGVLLPGVALDETEIANRYGVSRTPVREAIRNLAAAGLIEVRSHRSAVVARPPIEELRGMFVVMAELEASCAAKAARAMTATEAADLGALHEAMRDLGSDEIARYRDMNEQFHGLIYAGSHNAYLAEITLATRMRLSPFRRAQFLAAGRLATSFREHDRIVRAILKRDPKVAEAAMMAHIATVELAYEALTIQG